MSSIVSRLSTENCLILLFHGVIEKDESPLAAVRREVKEELGITLAATRLLSVNYLSADFLGGLPTTPEAIDFIFAGGCLSFEAGCRVEVCDKELIRARFFPLEEACRKIVPVLKGYLRQSYWSQAHDTLAYTENGTKSGNEFSLEQLLVPAIQVATFFLKRASRFLNPNKES